MKGISWGNEKEFNIQRNDFCGKYVVRYVFWRRESDLSGIDGADGRESDVAGSRRIFDYRSRTSASWCCSSRCEQKKWIIRSEQSGGQILRYFLYIDAVFDHRTIFCNSKIATVAFSVGLEQMIPKENYTMALAVFSLLFFAAVLFFSLRPGEILVWIGKVLNPLFLCFLAILVVRALISPMGEVRMMEAEGAYASGAFFTGVLEGYNTMDALASLAFGIIVVNVIRGLGVEEPEHTAKNTVKAGIFSSLLMAAIYLLVTLVGAQSRAVIGVSENGGVALAGIAEHYFGTAGALILAATVTLACLKTAVGLITSCGETFEEMVPKGPSYKVWAVGFCVISFVIANLGLNSIIAYSVPVLMFLYPLAITLILLTIFGKCFGNDVVMYRWVTGFTAVASVVDFANALPEAAQKFLHLRTFVETAKSILPFADLGFGWVCPALLGLVIGTVHVMIRKKEVRG